MDNSIQATSCKASAENFFRAEIYRTCHRQLLPNAWRFKPRSAMGADRGEVVAALPVRDTIRCFKQTRQVQVTEPALIG